MTPHDSFTVTAPDGATARLHPYGGQLVSWRTADGREQLFLSERAHYREGAAIRGGVPIIFPQFAGRGPLPKHGFARTVHWQPVPAAAAGSARLRLAADAATRRGWPYDFQLDLAVSIGGPTLRLELSVTNTDTRAFEFTAALHTYLRVTEIAEIRLAGLEGSSYLDATRGDAPCTAPPMALEFTDEVDRIYVAATQPLQLRAPGWVRDIRQWGFPDVVVWNPGRAKGDALDDLGVGAFREMVCIEAAAAAVPIHLAPGATWQGGQQFDVRP